VGISAQLLIFLLVGKGDTDRHLLLVGMAATAFGASGFLPPSMQAEVIDYDELHTGRRREAQYAGFWGILPKLAAIPGAVLPIALLPIALLASLGYVPNAPQRPEVSHAIRILYGLGPAIAAVASLAIVSRYPINAKNHAAILKGTERHKCGEKALDPLSGRELSPPGTRAINDASAGFLDNFSSANSSALPPAVRIQGYGTSDVPPRSFAACLITGAWRCGGQAQPGTREQSLRSA